MALSRIDNGGIAAIAAEAGDCMAGAIEELKADDDGDNSGDCNGDCGSVNVYHAVAPNLGLVLLLDDDIDIDADGVDVDEDDDVDDVRVDCNGGALLNDNTAADDEVNAG